jgi:hypothetical protein
VCRNTWEAFWTLNASRGNTGFGPAPLLYSELQAWCSLMGERLDRWEITLFRTLDRAYLEEASKKMDSDTVQ